MKSLIDAKALAVAARKYYNFTRKPIPASFNNAYNQEAIKVGSTLKSALERWEMS